MWELVSDEGGNIRSCGSVVHKQASFVVVVTKDNRNVYELALFEKSDRIVFDELSIDTRSEIELWRACCTRVRTCSVRSLEGQCIL